MMHVSDIGMEQYGTRRNRPPLDDGFLKVIFWQSFSEDGGCVVACGVNEFGQIPGSAFEVLALSVNS